MVRLSANATDEDQISINNAKFGDVRVSMNDKASVILEVTRMGTGKAARSFDVDTVGTPFNIDRLKSTCLSNTMKLNAGDTCIVHLETKQPITKETVIKAQTKLKYKLGKKIQKEILVDISGKFRVEGLKIDGENFGTIGLVTGDDASITLTVDNPSSSSISAAGNFFLHGISGYLSLDKNPATSTCIAGKMIRPGESCTLVLIAKPTKSENFSRDLKLKYKVKGLQQEIAFTLLGNFHLTAKPVLPPAPAPTAPPAPPGPTAPAPAPVVGGFSLLDDNMVGLANFYYKVAYLRDPSDKAYRIIAGIPYTVNRPNHALAHGLRKAALALDVITILREPQNAALNSASWVNHFSDKNNPSYNPNFEQQLAFGMLMLRTGRTAEDNVQYKQDAVRSAQFFVAEAPKTGIFPNQKDVDDFEFAFKAIGDTQMCFDTVGTTTVYTAARGCNVDRLYLYNFLYAVHHLDLRRMVFFDKKQIMQTVAGYLGFSSSAHPDVVRLWKRSGEYLALTGDSDMDKPGSQWLIYDDIFYILSHDPPRLRRELEALQKTPL